MGQRGLATFVIVVGMITLGLLTASGTYYFLNYLNPVESPAITAPNPSPLPSVTQVKAIEEVKAANEPALLEMEGVEKVEVGEKDGEPCVVVFSFEKTDELQNLENNGLEGYKVVVQDSPQTN